MFISATINENSEALESILESKKIQRALESGGMGHLNSNESQSWNNSEHLSLNKTKKTRSSGMKRSMEQYNSPRESEETGKEVMERKVKSEVQLKSLVRFQHFSLEFPRENGFGKKQFLDQRLLNKKDRVSEKCRALGLSVEQVTHSLRHEQHLLCECSVTSVRNGQETGVLLQWTEIRVGGF